MLQQAVEERPLLPDRWREASTFSDWQVRLTPARTEEVRARIAAVLEELEDAGGADAADATPVVFQIAVFPLLHGLDVLSFPALLALVAVAGALRGPGDAATYAMIPLLVQRAEVPTERATGLASMAERSAGMLGALAGGTLIALWSAGGAGRVRDGVLRGHDVPRRRPDLA